MKKLLEKYLTKGLRVVRLIKIQNYLLTRAICSFTKLNKMKKGSGFEKFFKGKEKTGGAKKEAFRQEKRQTRKQREEEIAEHKRQQRAKRNTGSAPPKYNLEPPASGQEEEGLWVLLDRQGLVGQFLGTR